MSRVRTLKQAVKEIREKDENTAITYNGLRMAVLNCEIPSVKRGNRFLVNLDRVEEYFNSGSSSLSTDSIKPIRKVI